MTVPIGNVKSAMAYPAIEIARLRHGSISIARLAVEPFRFHIADFKSAMSLR
jgi:hypothetical protein